MSRAALPLPSPSSLFGVVLVALGAALSAGCDSDADGVCLDITNCSHGGSDDFLSACEDQAKELSHEATRSGCDAAYNAYFSCADDHFECHGNQTSFPACEARLDALATCLDAARSSNACGELDAKLAACDASAMPAPAEGGASIEPCTTGSVCSARCYLDALANVCAPEPAELSAFAECASHCVL